ncbi:HsdM family class I SAM-dependent methyltransferase [Bathymodiolus platifrons methanotrophic gill symbiont]|uniref:HsdM family class I SAM-dependent methyltransferase n=1 Tax=Bathymodiolus platifrons methanotrophic gill symbiont TaxID=113268 RepID=UPI000B421B17
MIFSECVLEPTREVVLKRYNEIKDSGIELDLILPNESGFSFYNTSTYTLSTLGATDTRANLEDYISKFSSNVRVVFEEFDFFNTLVKLERAKLLYRIVNNFVVIDLHPNVVSDRVMSNVYEHLIRKFATSVNEKAGEFMTPRDVVRLATKLVLHEDEEIFMETGVIRSIYDPTCGTGGFLSDGIAQIKELSPTAKIVPFGQELDPETHALAMISMMIQGFETDKIKQGSTLSNDQLKTNKFHYGLANPPFGIKWGKDQDAVVKERADLGYAGRFGPGLPTIKDGSMLFLLHLVSKRELPENGGGRVGIVLSGSPLFNGKAGSGGSEIRRWLLEQDLVEAIIALPNDMFFNTGIGTYVWVLSNKKAVERKDKVQLINLSDVWSSMRKSEGKKRRYLKDEQIDDILREYDALTESEITKIFDTKDFGYRRIDIKRPLRAKLTITEEGITSLDEQNAFSKLKEEQQNVWKSFLTSELGDKDYYWAEEIVKEKSNTSNFGKATKAIATAIVNTFIVTDPELEVVLDKKGQVIPDTNLNDQEIVPLKQDIEDYFNEEVLPHVPDAFIDYSKRDEKDGKTGVVGYEINFNRYFYKYTPPRSLHDIDADLKASEARIPAMLAEVAE